MQKRKRNDRMLVLHIARGHPTPGLPHFYPFIAEQMKVLSSKVEVEVVVPVEKHLPVPRHRDNLKFSRRFPQCFLSNGYTVHFPKYYRYFPGFNRYLADYLEVWATLYVISRNRLRFDLVHAHFAHPPGFIAAIVSRLLGRPYVLTVHGSDILEEFVDPKWVRRRRRHRDLGLKRADKVICVSYHLRERVLEAGVSSEKTVVIPNGVDTEKFAPLAEKSENGSILYVGHLIQRKGVDLLIEAFKRISAKRVSTRLMILGNGPELHQLQERTVGLGIDERVEFLKQRANSEVAKIISRARVLCLPSREEGFGVVTIEALACGVPVVGSRTGGIVDIISSEEIGLLFEPGNSAELASKLELALKKKWNKNAIRQAGLKFSWDRVADCIAEQYQTVTARRGPRKAVRLLSRQQLAM